MQGPLLGWDAVGSSPGKEAGFAQGFCWSVGGRGSFHAPASPGFGILKQPRQIRSGVTNRADT